MNAEKSFTFPFEDKDWISKLGLGAIISLVPILNFAWSGYLVGIIRNVMHNDAHPLPTWDDLDKKFSEGLILFGASLVYASPLLIALCLPLGITVASGLLSGSNNLEDLSQRLAETGGILLFCLFCGFILYGIALSIIYPAVLLIFSRAGTFASCFKLREAFELISRNPGPFFTAWILSIAASLGVGLVVGFVNMVVSIVPCVGWIIGLALSIGSGIYATAVYAHLFGQFGRAAFATNPALPVVE
jgi:uncharacterized protein DUF4013